jgi:hypothetical protein
MRPVPCLDGLVSSAREFDRFSVPPVPVLLFLLRKLGYSTVTLLARFLGLSTSQPRATAVW